MSVKKILALVIACALTMTGHFCLAEEMTADQVMQKVQSVYADKCCFRALFDQVTVNISMDIKDTFEGVMYVRKPSFITLDVQAPERQKVVMRGRSYSVQFLEDQTSVTGEIPAELNVENFFSFFTNIGAIDKNFSFRFPQRPKDGDNGLIFLELTSAKAAPGSYRITLGIDSQKFTINRAIIYDALGNYNRFDLTDIKFLPSIPESIFEIATPK